MDGKGRRKLLKSLGSGIVGLSVTGVVAGNQNRSHSKGGNNKQKLSTEEVKEANFNPSSKKEVLRFLQSTFEESSGKPESETQELRTLLDERLSNKQKQAVKKALMNDVGFNVNTSVETGTTEDTISLQRNTPQQQTYAYTISTSITVRSCNSGGCVHKDFRAFDFTHEIQWYYDGDKVLTGSATCEGNGKNYAIVHWDYEGRSSYNKQTHPEGYYVKTFRQGRFQQNIVLDDAFDKNQYPSCWLQGGNTGTGSVYDITHK